MPKPDLFSPAFVEQLREEQRKTVKKLEEMKANLEKNPNQEGYAGKMKFVELALKEAKNALGNGESPWIPGS